MGVPIIATEYTSLTGSCLLIISAFISLFSRRQASVAAGIGVISVGSFWCIEPIKAILSMGPSWGLVSIVCVVWLLLAASSISAIRNIRAVVGDAVNMRFRKAVLGVSSVLFVGLFVGIEWRQKANERIPSRYELPDGYVGWVEIQHGIAGAPATPVRNKQFVFTIPAAGLLKTSTPQMFGTAHDHYFYCGAAGCHELAETGWGSGGMIWASSSGTFETPGQPDIHSEQFFIGTESQYQRMQSLPEMNQGVVPGDLRTTLP